MWAQYNSHSDKATMYSCCVTNHRSPSWRLEGSLIGWQHAYIFWLKKLIEVRSEKEKSCVVWTEQEQWLYLTKTSSQVHHSSECKRGWLTNSQIYCGLLLIAAVGYKTGAEGSNDNRNQDMIRIRSLFKVWVGGWGMREKPLIAMLTSWKWHIHTHRIVVVWLSSLKLLGLCFVSWETQGEVCFGLGMMTGCSSWTVLSQAHRWLPMLLSW